jgi:hypothetical protein
VQAVSGNYIHRDAKQIFQIRNQTGWKPWGMDRTHLNEKINVTLFRPFAARNRAEYAQLRNAMLFADFKDLLTLGLEKFFDLHSFIIQQCIFRPSSHLEAALDRADDAGIA